MLQTIETGTHISIQGEFVRHCADGNVMVRVGPSYYVGKPVVAVRRATTEDQTKLAQTPSVCPPHIRAHVYCALPIL